MPDVITFGTSVNSDDALRDVNSTGAGSKAFNSLSFSVLVPQTITVPPCANTWSIVLRASAPGGLIPSTNNNLGADAFSIVAPAPFKSAAKVLPAPPITLMELTGSTLACTGAAGFGLSHLPTGSSGALAS